MQIRLVKNKDTGESKGYAFITFKTKEVAQKAIEDLHNKDFKVILNITWYFIICQAMGSTYFVLQKCFIVCFLIAHIICAGENNKVLTG